MHSEVCIEWFTHTNYIIHHVRSSFVPPCAPSQTSSNTIIYHYHPRTQQSLQLSQKNVFLANDDGQFYLHYKNPATPRWPAPRSLCHQHLGWLSWERCCCCWQHWLEIVFSGSVLLICRNSLTSLQDKTSENYLITITTLSCGSTSQSYELQTSVCGKTLICTSVIWLITLS